MDLKQIFKTQLTAKNLFENYLPHIKNWKHKMRGINGNGEKIEFTDQEQKDIKKALKKLFSEIIK